jgi:hypothetical protein
VALGFDAAICLHAGDIEKIDQGFTSGQPVPGGEKLEAVRVCNRNPDA